MSEDRDGKKPNQAGREIGRVQRDVTWRGVSAIYSWRVIVRTPTRRKMGGTFPDVATATNQIRITQKLQCTQPQLKNCP